MWFETDTLNIFQFVLKYSSLICDVQEHPSLSITTNQLSIQEKNYQKYLNFIYILFCYTRWFNMNGKFNVKRDVESFWNFGYRFEIFRDLQRGSFFKKVVYSLSFRMEYPVFDIILRFIVTLWIFLYDTFLYLRKFREIILFLFLIKT